jgi:hypothetical protein
MAVTLGCAGTTATIHRTDAPPTEAEIDDSDASTLRLRGSTGNMLALDQYQVSSIDHPGNVWAVIGGVYAAAGVLMTVGFIAQQRSLSSDQRGGNGFEGMVGFITIGAAVVGLAAFVPNMFVWARSKVRAHAFESARPPDWMIPPAVPGKAERIAPLRPSLGGDDEDPDKKPPTGFHR